MIFLLFYLFILFSVFVVVDTFIIFISHIYFMIVIWFCSIFSFDWQIRFITTFLYCYCMKMFALQILYAWYFSGDICGRKNSGAPFFKKKIIFWLPLLFHILLNAFHYIFTELVWTSLPLCFGFVCCLFIFFNILLYCNVKCSLYCHTVAIFVHFVVIVWFSFKPCKYDTVECANLIALLWIHFSF